MLKGVKQLTIIRNSNLFGRQVVSRFQVMGIMGGKFELSLNYHAKEIFVTSEEAD